MPVRQDNEQNIRSLAFFETLYNSSADAILALDTTTILDGNRSAEFMFGRPKNEITGRSVLDLSPEFQPGGKNSKEMADRLFTAALFGEPQSFEWMYLRADGTPFPTEISLTRFLVGETVYLQASIRDITLRKLDEDELREAYGRISAAEKELRLQYTALAETEEMFRNPVENSPVGVYLQQDGIIRYANPRFAEMFGYVRDEVVGRSFDDFIRISNPVTTPSPDRSSLQRREFLARRKGGAVVELEIFEAPMEYRGRPALYGNVVDITPRRRAEATIRGLLNATRDEAVLTDNDGRILTVNNAFASGAGKPAAELANTILYDLIRTGGISMRTADEMQKKSPEPISFEEQIGERWFDTTIYSINDAEGNREQVGIFRHDITRLKNAEREVLAANEQLVVEKERLSLFAAALDNMRDCAVITKSMGQIIYVNETFKKRFMLQADEVLEKKLKDLAHDENQFELGDNFFFDYRDSDRQGLFLGKNSYGVKIPLIVTCKPILYSNRKPTHFVFVFREKMS
ncbi:MAG: PAS domain S-box protein [Methanomicrobiales archaeon]|nr:PAS domain S-box protein [Methanomicrobiales archaeon]